MLEELRMALLVAMLGMASYHDVKTREIPDLIWYVGVGIGALLYVFDWHEADSFALLSMGSGLVTAYLAWKLFPVGEADALAIAAASIVYPVSYGTVMNPIAVFFGGLILEHLAAFFYNLRYNTEDVILGRRIFSNVENSTLTKVMAFYCVHVRRPHEKFTFCAETARDGKKRIDLKTPDAESPYETRPHVFVTWAMPAFPFMLAAAVLAVAAAVLLS